MNSLADFLLANAKFARNIGIVFAGAVWFLHTYMTLTCMVWPFTYNTYAECLNGQMSQLSLLFLGAESATLVSWSFAVLIGVAGGVLTFVLHMLNKK